MKTTCYQCCIIGAGPAGLAAALELAQKGVDDILIIDRNKTVGGLSRTEVRENYRFDIGPHRFFTKNREINRLWHDMLGNDFLPVKRLTRVFYGQRFFNYPIDAKDIVKQLPLRHLIGAMTSYACARVSRLNKQPETFEEWVISKFGYKLYETFFKTYTEKVWGIPCSQISAEWASQRIKGLDIIEVMKKAVFGGDRFASRSLVERFHYPALGTIQMYEAMCERAVEKGVDLRLNSSVVNIHALPDGVESIKVMDREGQHLTIKADWFFSSLPLTHFYDLLDQPFSLTVGEALQSLYFRDHITVGILIDQNDLFPDQWVYVHAPEVKMARIANFNNFSTAMVSHSRKTALSVEFFVFQNEGLWSMSDADLIDLAIAELSWLNLIHPRTVETACVVRETECYPTYYLGFQEHYLALQHDIRRFRNLTQMGRAGLYKYNNQDHSILSGLLAARNYLRLPGSPYNLWNINMDAEYHESVRC